MPKAFVSCVNSGGRVRTVKPSANTYLAVCYKNGKAHPGELKHDKPRAVAHPPKK